MLITEHGAETNLNRSPLDFDESISTTQTLLSAIIDIFCLIIPFLALNMLLLAHDEGVVTNESHFCSLPRM